MLKTRAKFESKQETKISGQKAVRSNSSVVTLPSYKQKKASSMLRYDDWKLVVVVGK